MVASEMSQGVGKHRAPNGALRLDGEPDHFSEEGVCQKAPSAKRCIKTRRLGPHRPRPCGVTKHRAPKGALRRVHDVQLRSALDAG